MRLFLMPCTYTSMNMGDVALMQVATGRLASLFPEAVIEVPTDNRDLLTEYCPNVHPLCRGDWYSDHYLLGSIHRRLPRQASEVLVNLKRSLRRRSTGLEERMILLKLMARRKPARHFREHVAALESADMVVMSGAGGITDEFPTFSTTVLDTLGVAIRRGIPTAMFSQGIGPLERSDLLRRAKSVLPFVDMIALREKRQGLHLLEALGVNLERTITTGDDAVALALSAGTMETGYGIGVNFRTHMSTGIPPSITEAIRPILQGFAKGKSAPLIPLPIARQAGADLWATGELTVGYSHVLSDGRELDSPIKVIKQVGRCRIVVTAAYHAAVFALSQGIPAVCLARAPYCMDKFFGLEDLFGCGCQPLHLDSPDLGERLENALEQAWESADSVRAPMRNKAEEQASWSWAAYTKVRELGQSREMPGASGIGPADPRSKRSNHCSRGGKSAALDKSLPRSSASLRRIE